MRTALKVVSCVFGMASFLQASTCLADPLNISVASDDVALGQVNENGSVATVSGDIRVEEAHAPAHISAISGNIKIGRVAEGGAISAVSGDVSIGEAYKSLQIQTVSGNIRVDRVFGEAHYKTTSGDIDVALGDQDPPQLRDVSLTTVSGDVVFHISKSFAGSVDIWARQSEKDNKLPVIQSLGLNVETGPWEENSLKTLGLGSSNRTRDVHVSGNVGNGHEHLVIRTTSGTVRVVQE
ncbi:hypothetical protein AA106555_2028 [Neokomagataea thailandica NBRC 106555]|uniref:DUF4097 domain-containing protein n=2 Tax=Neokomagataea TaxID=1223423 RepID=A0A4Y6V7K7_9PROT|nr:MULTISPECIES: DUF4097 family beta strand repeat-containing protein [Neokomagataea]QDH24487.1 hypothetical protein D5366_03655 [Neokomagataea tanensis]GBR55479.1 hypothetical protein AA106555_2028 [Neokomagataea thailandica NBRC 106555]